VAFLLAMRASTKNKKRYPSHQRRPLTYGMAAAETKRTASLMIKTWIHGQLALESALLDKEQELKQHNNLAPPPSPRKQKQAVSSTGAESDQQRSINGAPRRSIGHR
jgi:hypothetical protein